MSLYRQLWLAIIACMSLAFCGSLAISALGARAYLETQLGVKNADGAQALALSMSQLPKDQATLELQVATLFEQGQYERIRVRDGAGRVLVEQADLPADRGLLAAVLPIAAPAGSAEIADGPRRFGTVELSSVSDAAYGQLESIALRLFGGFLVTAAVTGLLASWVLRRIRAPLARVVAQAEAIAERRFVTIAEPAAPELRHVARAMNEMVQRLRAAFDEEAGKLAALRRMAKHDALTGLPNRGHFMARLAALLDDESEAGGVLLLLRLRELAALNQRLGHAAVDTLLLQVAAALGAATAGPQDFGGRLNGPDLALVLPGAADAEACARALLAAAAQAAPDARLALGATHWQPGEALAAVLARADSALAHAESEQRNALSVASGEAGEALPAQAWRSRLSAAIETGQVRLARFPTCRLDGELLHHDCLARLDPDNGGQWLPAGRFLPYVARFGLHAELDLAVAGLVFDAIATHGAAHALNVSAASLASADFQAALLARLDAAGPAVARLLRIEVSEEGAFAHLDAFSRLAAQVRSRGGKAGIKHFGRLADQTGRLHALGLDYVKVDASLVRGVAAGQPQPYLSGLSSMLRALGCLVIAEGVQVSNELAALPALGFDGATGPAVQC